jgi:hypothetical protein
VWKPGTGHYLSTRYFAGLGVVVVSWIIFSVVFKKYRFKKKYNLARVLRKIILSNFGAFATVGIFIIAFQVSGYSRLIFFGTVGIATIVELILGNLYFFLLHTNESSTDIYNPDPTASDMRSASMAVSYRDVSLDANYVKEAIVSECGEEAYDFINLNSNFDDPKVLYVSTTTRFNIQFQPDKYFTQIVNFRRINDIQYINKFFETVNRKLPMGGYFIGCAERKEQRKKRILGKFPPVINRCFYFVDFVVKRIFPKFLLTKKIYFYLTRGNNRVVSRAEVLGRLYSCGFEVIEERDIRNQFYFLVKKVDEPAYNMNPTYGPFIKLHRIGKEGKLIKVYKFRTMHPYAEYLQEYVYKLQDLQDGGKIKDDFRISGFGKFMRSTWIDELPMIFNMLKGELKLVGVRPLSQHYYSLYSEELRAKRILYKPGLIPPFYFDMPKTLDEIQASEMRYLDLYGENPWRTDIKYFRKAVGNIVFRRARSC